MKAAADDFLGRFREIVSDPLNILINRHPQAGMIHEGMVTLHNGNIVPINGENAYYGKFSDILVINRGVHEPLEEYVFQQVLERLPEAPVMLELGAYWAHYSMWLKKKIPLAITYMVESDFHNLEVGKANFQINGMDGNFINETVGTEKFSVDQFVSDRHLSKIDILHADIQGFEVEMLEGCQVALAKRMINYIFVSTHSQLLHSKSLELIASAGYRIEFNADFEEQTTSYDGFIFASSPEVGKIRESVHPLGRAETTNSTALKVFESLVAVSDYSFVRKNIRDWLNATKCWLQR